MIKPWVTPFTALLGASAVMAAAGSASACACMPGDAAEQLKAVDVAFIGTADSIKPYRTIMGDTITIARFKVEETLVGTAQPWREVVYSDLGGSCGARYAVGQRYAVLTNHHFEGRLWPVGCLEREQTIEDYIKAERPPARASCATVAGPPATEVRDRRFIGQEGVIWRRCVAGGRDIHLATLTTWSPNGLCRVRVLNGTPFLVSFDYPDFVALSSRPCPALSLGTSSSAPPYTVVAPELSEREFRRLRRWVARRGGGELRQVEHYDAFFGLWRNYALWVERDGRDVFLRRRGLFSGLLV